MANYIIAKYIRLSVEDSQSDSMSIENQRLLLDRSIAEMDVPNVEVWEFVDNGHSGTNFERPAVQELLDLVRLGKVNCIAVKDFSRFGRSALETGYFIERMFPLYRVRFISLAEGFDSDNHIGDTGGLEISFHFLKNEWYSRDLSQKIKSARRVKQLRGEFITKNCAFGFKLNDRRQLVLDEPAADTARLIFEMYANEKSIADIQRRFYADKRPTPWEYKRGFAEPKCIWDKLIILKILRDEQYIGTYVAGRTKSAEVGSSRAIQFPESEWVKIPNHHPAIVDKAIFDEVQELLNVKGEPLRKRELGTNERYKDVGSMLKGKVFCGLCGHSMRLSVTKNAAFHCSFTRTAANEPCHGLKFLAAELESLVFAMIAKQTKAILSADPTKISQASELDFAGQIVERQGAIHVLYERYVLQEINADEYKSTKAVLDADISRLKAVAAESERIAEAQTSHNALREVAASVKGKRKLLQPLADALIDKVYVYRDNRVEVTWKLAGFVDTQR